ncbi:MAG: ribose transport system ATP-binding protein [Actinomycetota bacterium]|jgi:ABC-type sugar transport system ATPase subunit|nr:ribose transport system ATP-binding protein [Actinomycetota bacterium]
MTTGPAAAPTGITSGADPNVFPAALSLRGVSKTYAGVRALSGVDLDVHAGEALGLLGQNGAGKSTLVKIVSGAEPASSGRVLVSGTPMRFNSPADSQAAGIYTIYQELSVVPQLSVAENIYLSDLPRRRGRVDWKVLRAKARETLGTLGFDIDVEKRVRDLPLAQQQAIEIAKAVHHKSKVVLLDEPTATLPQRDVAKLFEILRSLKAAGVSIVYISHRLDEVYELCDRVTVLRDGQHIATQPTSELSQDDAVRLMVGDRLASGLVGQVATGGSNRINLNSPRSERAPALEVAELSDDGVLHNVSITVMPGEAVAVAGLVGSGQSELAACIFGSRPRVSGRVLVDGKDLPTGSPQAAIRAGVGWLPEERKHQGLVLNMPVAANLTMANLRRVASLGLLRLRAEERLSDELVRTLSIKAGPGQKVGSLSGGNQQKVVFGKWLTAMSTTLILSEPTRGIDIAAKEEIYREVRKFLDKGGSVLVISSEIDEALMCDRVYVIARGTIVGQFRHDDIERDQLLSLLR